MRKESRRELLLRIQELCFACLDMNLYLDTHPEDQKAVNTFNSLSKQFMQAKCAYESKYGPLTNFGHSTSNCNNWQWVCQPWPWDREVNY
ncbi:MULTISPECIES: spore coat protein CotJB [Clostridia]|uniref:spore coat protein CotJB n=1 Tax=Clostridium sp. CCUG 7971 TaxID=2811414 RepID=UPI001ABB3ECF|nr:spore coat protein CotJB [Clostridium sp. CCUG 7971]MBO3446447.1 spore coat protein CotJB [Clostridium sp. CCUG 7971]